MAVRLSIVADRADADPDEVRQLQMRLFDLEKQIRRAWKFTSPG